MTSSRTLKNILVTGGGGFIGSNLIRYIFKKTNFTGNIINLDSLTYAGNPYSLNDISEEYGSARYFFEKADIRNHNEVVAVFKKI